MLGLNLRSVSDAGMLPQSYLLRDLQRHRSCLRSDTTQGSGRWRTLRLMAQSHELQPHVVLDQEAENGAELKNATFLATIRAGGAFSWLAHSKVDSCVFGSQVRLLDLYQPV